MSLWNVIESDVTDVLLNDFDGMTCTAIQLPGGETFTGFYADSRSEQDKDYGIANSIRATLWIPISAKPKQRSTWRISLPDGETIEATGISHGERSGGLLCIHLERLDVSKFSGSFNGQR